MSAVEAQADIRIIVQEIDRLIGEMSVLRSQVSALDAQSGQPGRSVCEADYFGMWAEREEMQGLTPRTWLEGLRAREWSHR